MTPTYQSTEPPTDEWAHEVCKVGKGHACCRYLAIAAGGWSCEKHTDLAEILDARVATESMTARSDNCLGRGHRS